MHVNIQHRFNKEIDSTAMYYRLKESYRDVRGNVHSLIVLNIGFEPSLQPNDIRRIAQALSRRMKTRENNTLFGDWSEGLSNLERAKAEAGRYIDLDTVEHTEAREVGAEWLCNKTDSLFNLENRIVLFDLNNYYFEGRKAASEKAKFGRSKASMNRQWRQRFETEVERINHGIQTKGGTKAYDKVIEGLLQSRSRRQSRVPTMQSFIKTSR